MPEKQYRNTITNLEPDVPRPEAASDNNVIHTPQAAELIERDLPELEAAELGLPELATRPEPASPPVAAKGGRGEAKTGAGAGDRERRGEGAERGTPPPPPPLPLSPLPPPSLSSLSLSQSPPPLLCCAAAPPPLFFGLFGCPSGK